MAFERGGSLRKLVFVMILLAVTLISIDVRGNRQLDTARSTSRDLFSPVRDGFALVFRPFENVWHGIRDYDRLRQDYATLRDKVSRGEGTSIEAETQIQELNELRAQFGLLPCSTIPPLLAEIVGRPATNYESSFEINRGADDGLVSGMPVVTPAGLIGRVGKVSANHAFVQTLEDPTVHIRVNILGTKNSKKSAEELLKESAVASGGIATPTTAPGADPTTTTSPGNGNGDGTETTTTVPAATTSTVPPTTTTTVLVPNETGDLYGNGRGKPLSIAFVSGSENVKVGDPVSTANVDASLFPGCLPVGRVATVNAKKGSTQLDVTVDPVADLGRLSLVTVILYDPSRRQVKSAPEAPTTTSIP